MRRYICELFATFIYFSTSNFGIQSILTEICVIVGTAAEELLRVDIKVIPDLSLQASYPKGWVYCGVVFVPVEELGLIFVLDRNFVQGCCATPENRGSDRKYYLRRYIYPTLQLSYLPTCRNGRIFHHNRLNPAVSAVYHTHQ